jgi:hypothetical protein
VEKPDEDWQPEWLRSVASVENQNLEGISLQMQAVICELRDAVRIQVLSGLKITEMPRMVGDIGGSLQLRV